MISKFRCFLILTFVSTLILLLFSFIMSYGGVRLHDQLYWKDSKNGLHLDAVSLSRVDQTTSHLRFPSEEKTTVKRNYQAPTVVTGINYMDGVSSFAPDRLDVLNKKHLQVASKSHLLLYAAYYDDVRKTARITIVGIRSSSFSQTVNCSFSNTRSDQPGDTTLLNTTAGRVTDLPDHHSSQYRPVYIFCSLPEGKSRPDHVSVVCHNDSVPNLLQITYPYKGPHRYQFSIVGCMHDCLLRMRYVTKYVVFIDLDELIILRTNNTLREMVEHVMKQTKDADKVGAIMVRNSFFHHAPQEINITDTYLQANLTGGLFTKARLYDLKSVLMQFRGKPWEPPQRCRTIADPLRVDTMAVHHPETMFGDFKVVVVDPKIGLLHHYRYGWYNEDTVRDTTAHRLTPILVKRLESVYKQLGLKPADDHRR
ncbi:uncharacterized protein LOC112566020 [Pomacea canaliculata]|uniref:uncharacterized protein LOC112566020 n=1 Tax=Pomacea canaliculata TaxID=400727 RepID=UPI000D73DF35|nr:uncharacterized protein LOC112566020 [Pomacea canaliculata]